MKIKTTIMLVIMSAVVGCMSTTWRGTAIQNRLSETTGLGAHDISIDERVGGVITLSGTVSSDQDRYTVEGIARNTEGVKEVRNNLVIAPSSVIVREGGIRSSDDEDTMVSEIMAKMASSPEIRDYNLKVEVFGDTVVLRGEVGNQRERAAAERIALNTRGITTVRNKISLFHDEDHSRRRR